MTGNARALTAGVIGFGLAGRHFHTPLLEAAGFDIRAVVSSQVAEVSKRLPNAVALASDAQLFSREDIDLVVIASPNAFHFRQASDALRAGKHVVVDKPLCLTVAEADQLIELANRQHLQLAAFQNRRWDCDFLTVRKLIADGALGEISSYHARWNRFRPEAAAKWRDGGNVGAGMLYDLGSHLIDQALVLFGKPDWVLADVFAQRPGAANDDGFEILMGKGALRISLGVSSLAVDADWRFCVHGLRGSFFKAGFDPQEGQLRSGMSPAAEGFGLEPVANHGRLFVGSPDNSRPIESEPGQWTMFYESVRKTIAGQGASPVPATEARRTLEIIEAAYRSSAEGRRIAVG